jgi:hypothetical protein
MGILLSALAASGDSGVESINQNRKQASTLELQQRQAELETAKARTIEEMKIAAQNAPLNRFAAIAQGKASEDVPVAAAPVTQLSGQDPTSTYIPPDGSPGPTGLTGSYEKNKALIAQIPDPQMRADAMAQLDRQLTADTKSSQDAVAGQTRKMTPTQAVEAALQAARLNDPAAYAAAKTALGDKFITIPDGGTLFDTTSGKPVAQSTGKQDRQDQREDRRDARQIDAEDARASRQDKAIASVVAKHQALSEMTPTMETNARAIANGQLPPITGFGLRSPGAAAVMARVLEINPDYSAKDYGTGSKAEKDFATGKQGNSVRSFNVAIDHLGTLSSLADALDNGDMQLVNKVGNMVATQTGATAPVSFEAAKHIVADEIVKAVTGSAGALGDREAAAKTINSANSPAQLKGVIKVYQDLMSGQLNGLRSQYKATTGKDDFDAKYLSDAARSVSHAARSPARAQPQGPAVDMPGDVADLLKKYGG